MSTLNIDELKNLANNHNLLGDSFIEKNFQPSSYDLRIGAIFKDNEIFSLDFEKDGFTNTIDIKPSEIVSMLTLETVSIPHGCVGTVFAINKLSSTGLLILNPGHIDPGYIGPLSVCAINLSKETKVLSIGDSIFTLIIQKLQTPLSSDKIYLNTHFPSRKAREQDFLKKRSKKLSSSVFDLVNDSPGAQKMLSEILFDRFWRIIKVVLKLLTVIAALAGILKLGYDMFPGAMPVYTAKSTGQPIDSIEIKDRDSIIRQKNIEILNLQNQISDSSAIKFRDSIIFARNREIKQLKNKFNNQ